MKLQQMINIRTKKIGLLIYDARLASHENIEACALAMGTSQEKYLAYEKGQIAPSLPELESLAYYLDIPLEQFWSNQSISQKIHKKAAPRLEILLPLRNRIIGTSLRLFQNEAKLSLSELAEKSEISEETLRKYESGEKGIPIPTLEILASVFKKRIEDFYDSKGPIGDWRNEQDTLQKFSELPPEMQQFICKSVNRPYLQLAMRLSSLDVEKLRLVAEGLLEITL